jgi:hypothetical protein
VNRYPFLRGGADAAPPNWQGANFDLPVDSQTPPHDPPTHTDLYYRLGDISGKIDAIQRAMIEKTSNIEQVGDRLRQIELRVSMLTAGVVILAFVIPLGLNWYHATADRYKPSPYKASPSSTYAR